MLLLGYKLGFWQFLLSVILLLVLEQCLIAGIYIFAFFLSPPFIERDVGDPIRLNLK